MVPPRSRKRPRPASESAVAATHPPVMLPELPVSALRRYVRRYALPVAEPMSLVGYLGSGLAGAQSESSRAQRRSTPDAARAVVQSHLRAGTIREGDTVAEFLYALEHRREAFKLNFGELHRDNTRALSESVRHVVHDFDEREQQFERQDDDDERDPEDAEHDSGDTSKPVYPPPQLDAVHGAPPLDAAAPQLAHLAAAAHPL